MSQAQYQQNPKPPDGTLFNIEDIQFYRNEPLYSRIRVWDLATTTGNSSDYTVGGLYGYKNDCLFLDDIKRGKWQYNNTKRLQSSKRTKMGMM